MNSKVYSAHLQNNVPAPLQSLQRVHKLDLIPGKGHLVEPVTVGLRRCPVLRLRRVVQSELPEREKSRYNHHQKE